MTVSTTPCCTSAPEGTPCQSRRVALAALLLLWLACAAAAEMSISNAWIAPGDEAYVLNADATLELSSRLEDVVSRGVPLYIVLDFELTRPRWYWFDEKVAVRTQTYRLSYHAITRQYRLSTGALHQSFNSLDEALHIVARVRDWSIADKSALKAGETYSAAVRLRVDLTQLPKPLQVTAIGSKEWNLGSDWQRWAYTAPEQETK